MHAEQFCRSVECRERLIVDTNRRGVFFSFLFSIQVVGLKTNISFLTKVTEHPAFIAADIETNFIQRYKDDLLPATKPTIPDTTIALATLAELLRERKQYATGTTHPPTITGRCLLRLV
jgi:acetyl/propionyl-CoA carboxylase alpha subunit